MTMQSHILRMATDVSGDFIPTPAPTPANFGDAFEGGFYTGMIWNSAAYSDTALTSGVGTKILTVHDMSEKPTFYFGQHVEIRQRSTSLNLLMVGTVVGAKDDQLTVNVHSSASWTGAFGQWHVMARYRMIVAPKSTGEISGTSLVASASIFTPPIVTLNEGLLATESLLNGDESGDSPAAEWVSSLSIGGYTDWFIPAINQLELAYRNLKPTDDNNFTVDISPGESNYRYETMGAYVPDYPIPMGANPNSVPVGGAYTTSVPSRTPLTDFQSGGSQALYDSVNTFYWSSSFYLSAMYWRMTFSSSSQSGRQLGATKNQANRIRAFRRSII